MPSDPPSPPLLADWAEAAAPRRALRRVAQLAGLVMALLLAAWAVPPLLDWGRFRADIAAIAAARLGRPVTIGGDVTLRLLPEAVLAANDVTIQDQGDGISIKVTALRLQVATWPLIAGRIVLRDLVLSAPVLRLPWALPEGFAHPSRPQLPHAFAARIENGTLRVGDAEITAINAAIHGGPAPTALAGAAVAPLGPEPPVAAFAAEGFASAAGRSWRFTSALGAPDADGVSAVDISMHGEGPAGSTSASLQATLADGVVQGRLHAGGPDLSLLLPGSPMAWQADAPFVASADHIEANAISLSLGGAPADAALNLSLSAPARLDGTLHAAATDLEGWAALLGTGFAVRAPRALVTGLLPMHIRVTADSARLLGGALHDVRATLVSDGHQLGLNDASATLPGGASLTAPRVLVVRLRSGAHPLLAASGHASLAAPDLRATLAWLRPLAPASIDALPASVLAHATLSGDVTLSATSLSVAGLSGELDGTPVSGSLALETGARAAVRASLTLDTLVLDPWLAFVPGATSLPAFGAHFTAPEVELHLAAKAATFGGRTFTALHLEAATGAHGLLVSRAEARLAGVAMSFAGGVDPNGRLRGLHAAASVDDLGALGPLLPPEWRACLRLDWLAATGLWHGPASLALRADGPPDALNLQLRADLRDLNLEAEATHDATNGATMATLTARHPGAPRLLADLGFPGGKDAAIAWLGTGSFAARAAVSTRAGHLGISDFDVTAAALRASGALEADWTGRVKMLTGRIEAANLPLPAAELTPAQAAVLSVWDAHLHVSAEAITRGSRTLLTNLAGDIAEAGGVVLADNLTAGVLGGHADVQMAANLTVPSYAVRGAVSGASWTGALTNWPIDLESGTLDAGFDLGMDATPATLSGEVHAALRDARLSGLDLGTLSAASAQHTRAGRAAVKAALAQGATAGLSGTIDASIARGELTLTKAALASPGGTISVAGQTDLAGGPVDLHLAIVPAGPNPPSYGLRLSGQGQGVSVQAERKGRKKVLF